MSERFSVIYADPPWSYNDKAMAQGGAERHYTTMPLADICALPVAALAQDDSALFIWTTFPMLFDTRDVIRAWGFEYKTCAFVWVKTNITFNPGQSSFLPTESFDSFWGMGHWTRSNAELCLLAVRGKPKRESGAVHQLIYAPVSRHSRKPTETRDRIVELCGDVSRVELFARETAVGWKLWGNEVESSVELDDVLQAKREMMK